MKGVRLRKSLIVLLTFVFTFSMSIFGWLMGAGNASAEDSLADLFAGGTGTEQSPYEIATAKQLANLAYKVNRAEVDNDTYFKLTADIDLSEYGANYAENIGRGWIPIGDSYGHASTSFSAHFDGDGHVIKNLYIIDPVLGNKNAGLFGYTINTAEIKNVGIESGSITGSYNTGALVGNNGGTILNCYNKASIGNVSGSAIVVGGIAGLNSGTIKNCYNTADVTTDNNGSSSGGIVGTNAGGLIINCYNSGNIKSDTGLYMGGIAGYNERWSKIVNCYNKGNISGLAELGGIAGCNEINGLVSNCYSIATIGGRWGNDEIIGDNLGTVANCFPNSSATYAKMTDDNILTTVLSPLQNPVDGIDGSAGQWVKRLNTVTYDYYPELKVFAGEDALAPDTIIQIDSRESVKITKWAENNAGSETDPFLIYTLNNLIEFSEKVDSQNFSGKFVELMADIDLAGIDFKPIGVRHWHGVDQGSWFDGNFNGNRHIIKNLEILNLEYAGLFACVGINATIKNLGIVGGSFDATRGAGGIVGKNLGKIENCYNTADVVTISTSCSGGIAGENLGTIINCFNTGEISGEDFSGGIAGINSGLIFSCFNNGNILGVNNVGGISGQNEDPGIIINCYNAGTISAGGGYMYGSRNSGGILGSLAGGAIINCYNIGIITDNKNTGGIIGFASGGTISNCFFNIETFSGQLISNDTYSLGRLTTSQMTHENVLDSSKSGAMSDLQNAIDSYGGNHWYKRSNDSYYDYYPELLAFINPNNEAFVNASIDSVKIAKDDRVTINGWTYDEQPNAPIPIYKQNITRDEPSYIYTSQDGTSAYNNSAPPANSGDYMVIATFLEGNTAYAFFTIAKATPVYTIPANLTAVYGQTLNEIGLPQGFSWELDETTPVGNAGKNPFRVTFTPTPDKLDNYKIVNNITVHIQVEQATPNPIKPTGLTVEYGKTLADISLKDYSEFSWETPSMPVGALGTKEFAAIYTPLNSNYKTIDVQLSVTVEQATPNPIKPTGLTVEYGKTLENILLSDYSGFNWKMPGTSVGNAGLKTFTAIYTPNDTVNYKTIEVELSVTVTQLMPTYTLPTGLTVESGKTLADISLSNYSGFSWKTPSTSVGEVGTRKFTAIYTPSDATNYKTIEVEIEVAVTAASSNGTGGNNLPNNGTTVGILIGSIAFVTIGIFLMLIFISKKRKANR